MAASLRGKTILLTGCGSLGLALVPRLLEQEPRTLRLFDASEHALLEARKSFTDPRLRLILGDITDERYVATALSGVDAVIHTAAVKTVEAAEYSPFRVIDVNVKGLENLLLETWHYRPKRVLTVSSDKSLNLHGIYHATKYLCEQLTLWAQRVRSDTIFSVFRPGNFVSSKSNVFESWKQQAEAGRSIRLTDPRMRRYFIDTSEVADVLVECFLKMRGGEIFVPICQEYSLHDLAKEFASSYNVRIETVGRRGDEALREELMSVEEKKRAVRRKRYWEIDSGS